MNSESPFVFSSLPTTSGGLSLWNSRSPGKMLCARPPRSTFSSQSAHRPSRFPGGMGGLTRGTLFPSSLLLGSILICATGKGPLTSPRESQIQEPLRALLRARRRPNDCDCCSSKVHPNILVEQCSTSRGTDNTQAPRPAGFWAGHCPQNDSRWTPRPFPLHSQMQLFSSFSGTSG